MPELQWLKSSFSGDGGNNCVELTATADGLALRESDNPTEVLRTHPGTLGALIRSVKAGPRTLRAE
ncbi:DUF397 domain-containing protein [Streptomyces sp. O3]